MIKFINWFIRPLGYVCVSEYELEMERLKFYGTTLENAERDLANLNNLLNSPSFFESQHYMFIGFDYAKEEKPEYKDNVVRFDKYV